MTKRFRLGLKFSLLLGMVFIASTLLSTALLSRTAHLSAQQQVAGQAILLMETMNSVRNYTSTKINPLVYSQDKSADFILESVPAYSAREVFNHLRSNPKYEQFLYKEATLNPTNPKDTADELEREVINQFRDQPDLPNLEGFRKINGESLFYTARPIPINQESCLVCHSTPDKAPKSMIDIYGPDHGFGWQLNEIVGAQVMYVPASQVFASYRRQFSLMMGIFVGSFLLAILLINWMLQRSVIRPIVPMARSAQKLSNNQMDNETSEQEIAQLGQISRRTDEIGQLARLFQEMVESIVSREQGLRQALNRLRFETDESKQLSMLNEITDSMNCQQLLKRSQSIRNRHTGE